MCFGVICSFAGCSSGSKFPSGARNPSSAQGSVDQMEVKAYHAAENAISHHNLKKLQKIFAEHQFSQEDKNALLVHYSIRSSLPPLFFGSDKSESQAALDVIGFLIDNGANVNSLPPYGQPQDRFSGPVHENALNQAVEDESYIIVKYLLEHGADPNGIFCYDANNRPYAAEDGQEQPLLHGTAIDQANDFASDLEKSEGFEGDAKLMRKIAVLIQAHGGHSGDGITGDISSCDQVFAAR